MVFLFAARMAGSYDGFQVKPQNGSEKQSVFRLKFLRKGKAAGGAAALCPLLVFCLFRVFALLVCNAAGGLASGLTGCLAFTATANLCALFKISGFYRLDSFHYTVLLYMLSFPYYSGERCICQVVYGIFVVTDAYGIAVSAAAVNFRFLRAACVSACADARYPPLPHLDLLFSVCAARSDACLPQVLYGLHKGFVHPFARNNQRNARGVRPDIFQ